MRDLNTGFFFGLALTFTLAGCGSAVPEDGDTENGSSSSGAASSTSGTPTTGPGVTTDDSATSAGVTTTPTTADDTANDGSTGNDDAGFITPETGDDTSIQPQPNGAQCAAGAECDSGFCYTIPQVGGVCSECLVDEDCDAGTCSIEPVGFAVCTDGSQGNMCNTDEGCMGELVCTELIDTGGLINASFCSVCGPTAPCDGEQVCTPQYDLASFGGSFVCVDPGSVPNGEGCPTTDGDAACNSGHCGIALLLGFAEIGVCGECSVDEDCPEVGQTCVPPEAGMGGLVPAMCQ